jgi:hypothetical protein
MIDPDRGRARGRGADVVQNSSNADAVFGVGGERLAEQGLSLSSTAERGRISRFLAVFLIAAPSAGWKRSGETGRSRS